MEARAARAADPAGQWKGIREVPSSCCSRSAISSQGACSAKYSLPVFVSEIQFILQDTKTRLKQRWLILRYSTYRKLVSSNSSACCLPSRSVKEYDTAILSLEAQSHPPHPVASSPQASIQASFSLSPPLAPPHQGPVPAHLLHCSASS